MAAEASFLASRSVRVFAFGGVFATSGRHRSNDANCTGVDSVRFRNIGATEVAIDLTS